MEETDHSGTAMKTFWEKIKSNEDVSYVLFYVSNKEVMKSAYSSNMKGLAEDEEVLRKCQNAFAKTSEVKESKQLKAPTSATTTTTSQASSTSTTLPTFTSEMTFPTTTSSIAESSSPTSTLTHYTGTTTQKTISSVATTATIGITTTGAPTTLSESTTSETTMPTIASTSETSTTSVPTTSSVISSTASSTTFIPSQTITSSSATTTSSTQETSNTTTTTDELSKKCHDLHNKQTVGQEHGAVNDKIPVKKLWLRSSSRRHRFWSVGDLPDKKHEISESFQKSKELPPPLLPGTTKGTDAITNSNMTTDMKAQSTKAACTRPITCTETTTPTIASTSETSTSVPTTSSVISSTPQTTSMSATSTASSTTSIPRQTTTSSSTTTSSTQETPNTTTTSDESRHDLNYKKTLGQEQQGAVNGKKPKRKNKKRGPGTTKGTDTITNSNMTTDMKVQSTKATCTRPITCTETTTPTIASTSETSTSVPTMSSVISSTPQTTSMLATSTASSTTSIPRQTTTSSSMTTSSTQETPNTTTPSDESRHDLNYKKTLGQEQQGAVNGKKPKRKNKKRGPGTTKGTDTITNSNMTTDMKAQSTKATCTKPITCTETTTPTIASTSETSTSVPTTSSFISSTPQTTSMSATSTASSTTSIPRQTTTSSSMTTSSTQETPNTTTPSDESRHDLNYKKTLGQEQQGAVNGKKPKRKNKKRGPGTTKGTDTITNSNMTTDMKVQSTKATCTRPITCTDESRHDLNYKKTLGQEQQGAVNGKKPKRKNKKRGRLSSSRKDRRLADSEISESFQESKELPPLLLPGTTKGTDTITNSNMTTDMKARSTSATGTKSITCTEVPHTIPFGGTFQHETKSTDEVPTATTNSRLDRNKEEPWKDEIKSMCASSSEPLNDEAAAVNDTCPLTGNTKALTETSTSNGPATYPDGYMEKEMPGEPRAKFTGSFRRNEKNLFFLETVYAWIKRTIVRGLETNARRIVNNDWIQRINSSCIGRNLYEAMQTIRPEVQYNGGTVKELLRFIRNVFSHYYDVFPVLPEDVKTALGYPRDKIWDYFKDEFPLLLDHVYRVMQQHAKDGAFTSYY